MKPAEGFVLVDKPGGWTSHDVVAEARTLFSSTRVGHAGTLDPPATGLLVLALGRCTRLLRFVQQLPKVYEATVVFGVATDTLDASGAILAREPMPITEEDLAAVIPRFQGTIHQVPPMVSAVRVEGTRLYELARQGLEVERPPRPVEVYAIEIEEFSPGDYPEALLRIRCGAGTYVRSLADDLARALGGRAHLSMLRRTATGTLSVEAAHPVHALREFDPDARGQVILAAAEGLVDLPAWRPDPATLEAVRHGMPFPVSVLAEPTAAPLLRVLDEDRALVAVYERRGGALRPQVVMA